MKNEQHRPEPAWMRALVEAHASDLTRYATSILNDADAARDVVQETFLAWWQAIPPIPPDEARPWLFRVCRNRAFDARRKGGRMNSLNDVHLATVPTEDPNPQVLAEKHDRHSRVLTLMKDLPENQQDVVRLKFQNGMSYQEISVVTELSVSNVGFLLHTALNTLRIRTQAAGE